jgi:CIC family chloride channel protein
VRPLEGLDGIDGQRLTEDTLGDFTLTFATARLVPLAVVVGGLSALVALVLLDLIGVVTNLAYYGRLSTSLVQPSFDRLGVFAVVIPVVGGGLVGLMAYYGSERVRGHGIPEAMETILTGGSRVEPRLTVLKPISSAVSIGSGGPFGAEGPIILTGGAVGSVFAQFLHLTAIERRTLLVAGACGGMAAVFGTPVAAVLFGVELLVFEWRPRSMVPITASVIVASVAREVFASHGWIRAAPLFRMPPAAALSALQIGEAVLLGLAMGLLAWLLTTAVYGAEDAFKRLPLHWAWWPMLGGLVVGIGGLIDPRALGVGYATISAELAGRIAIGGLVVLLVVKLVIWSVALGSGTSGGILAPLLICGAAAGGIFGHGFGGPTGIWALLGMAGTLAGVTRSPFTSIVFGLELTHQQTLLLPLLATCTVAHFVSALVLKRSILTEKVARRGFHVMREYAVDPLEALFVGEVMRTDIRVVPPHAVASGVRDQLERDTDARRQRLFPVVGDDLRLVGVIGWSHLKDAQDPQTVDALLRADVIVAYRDEVLRAVATRMADHELGALPVIERDGSRAVVGIITEFELLAGRRRQLVEERHRERPFRLRPPRTRPRRPTPSP